MDTINLNELEKLIHVIFSNLKNRFGESLTLNNDYYWEIYDEDLYNPYKTPQVDALGQLSDDITRINKLIKDKDDLIMYDLKKVAEILKAISIEYSEGRGY